MTRAKEKLIVTGTVAKNKKADSYEEKWDLVLPDADSVMRSEDAGSAGCFMDWIAPVARRADDLWKYEIVSEVSLQNAEFTDEEELNDTRMNEDFSVFNYSYGDLSHMPTKISVTELKFSDGEISVFSNEVEPETMPEFLRPEKKITAARKGTVLHTVMQNAEPEKSTDKEYVLRVIEELVKKEEFTREEAEQVDAEKIVMFYKSDLGKRIIKSKNTVREAPFETEIPISYFEKYKDFDETILLQGVIDCYFEEDDGIILIDYKSDYYNNPEEMKQKYAKQLYWYAYAIEKITHKKVKEKYI